MMVYQRIFSSILLLLSFFLFLPDFNLTAQKDESSQLADFEIVVQASEDKISMACDHGCTWKELSFAPSDVPQAIDEHGMTTLTTREVIEASEFTPFLFTIETTGGAYRISGKEGTAWVELTYDCSDREICTFIVNESGVSGMQDR